MLHPIKSKNLLLCLCTYSLYLYVTANMKMNQVKMRLLTYLRCVDILNNLVSICGATTAFINQIFFLRGLHLPATFRSRLN